MPELLERFELGPYAKAKPETLSGGFRRRLMIARALVHRPRPLFLDEPTTGLDPQARMSVWDLVDRLRAEGQSRLAGVAALSAIMLGVPMPLDVRLLRRRVLGE